MEKLQVYFFLVKDERFAVIAAKNIDIAFKTMSERFYIGKESIIKYDLLGGTYYEPLSYELEDGYAVLNYRM